LEPLELKLDDNDHQTETEKKKKENDSHLNKLFAQPTFQLQQEQECRVVLTHCWAILYKKFLWSVRDARAMFFYHRFAMFIGGFELWSAKFDVER
jgi:hypothetical protein